MTFHILLGQITALFLGLNTLTTLSFESDITSFYYGGNKEDVFLKVTDGKTLIIRANRLEGLSNLMVSTEKRKFYFQMQDGGSRPHGFIEVKHGVMNHALSAKITTEEYQILEGRSSILFVNKRRQPVWVNDKEVRRREYFSKGVPIIYENKRILN